MSFLSLLSGTTPRRSGQSRPSRPSSQRTSRGGPYQPHSDEDDYDDDAPSTSQVLANREVVRLSNESRQSSQSQPSSRDNRSDRPVDIPPSRKRSSRHYSERSYNPPAPSRVTAASSLRSVDQPHRTRLIQSQTQSWNIHVRSQSAAALAHHKIMVREYGLECSVCVQLDLEQFGYVPRPAGYVEVGIDDPFCMNCGLKHPEVDEAHSHNVVPRKGRLSQYDDDGDSDGVEKSQAKKNFKRGILKRVTGQRDDERQHGAEEDDQEEVDLDDTKAVVDEAMDDDKANEEGEPPGTFAFSTAPKKGGKGRKKDNQ